VGTPLLQPALAERRYNDKRRTAVNLQPVTTSDAFVSHTSDNCDRPPRIVVHSSLRAELIRGGGELCAASGGCRESAWECRESGVIIGPK